MPPATHVIDWMLVTENFRSVHEVQLEMVRQLVDVPQVFGDRIVHGTEPPGRTAVITVPQRVAIA